MSLFLETENTLITDSNKEFIYNIEDKNQNKSIGTIGYTIISTMNEYQLIELIYDFKEITFIYEIIDNFIGYLIREKNVLKINIKVSDKDIEMILKKIGFVLVDNTNYKITKPIYLKR